MKPKKKTRVKNQKDNTLKMKTKFTQKTLIDNLHVAYHI